MALALDLDIEGGGPVARAVERDVRVEDRGQRVLVDVRRAVGVVVVWSAG